MGLFGQIKDSLSPKPAQASQKSNQEDLIKIYDKYGRELLITKEEWRKKVLPDIIKQHWNNSNELYKDIVTALRDGFFSDIIKASERLLEIDKNKEESYIVRAIVLKENGRLNDARAILQDYIDKYGETGYVLTNLAKYYPDKDPKVEELLWKGLLLDPNQENGLVWWLAIHREKGGDAAYLNELKKVAEINGSWRAQLLLAREALKEKNLPSAVQYYRYVIEKAKDVPDVLMMISGDLGRAGYYDEIFTLVLPVYDPEKYDVYAAINILQAYLETKKYDEGKKFLKIMFSVNRPDIREKLMFYSNKFDEGSGNLPKEIEKDQKISVAIVAIDKPIFYYGLKGAEWLLPKIKKDGPKIGFMPFASIGDNKKSVIQQEDDIGRLTRSIPLYVSEALFFETNSTPQVLMPVVMGGGMVTTGTEYDVDYFLDAVSKSKDKQEVDFYITGTIKQDGDNFDIISSIWYCKTKEKIKSISQKTTKQEIGKTIKNLTNEILTFMNGKKNYLKIPPVAYYKPLDNNLIETQLLAYGQAFVLVLVYNNYIKKDAIWGERSILRNPLDLTLSAPDNLIPKLLFISNLVKAQAYGSDVYVEFKEYAMSLINDNKKDENIINLAPIIYKIFGMNKEFDEFAKNIYKYPEDYRNWFEKIRSIK